MKEITTSKGTFIFVEVPEDSDEYQIIESQNNTRFFWNDGECRNDYDLGEDIPHGNKYEFICTTKNATEEHAAMVVDTHLSMISNGIAYKNYSPFDAYEGYIGYDNPLHSLQSLLSVRFFNPNNNYAIIQKL